MTIRDLMATDCLDVDEILMTKGEPQKKEKEIKPLYKLVKEGG